MKNKILNGGIAATAILFIMLMCLSVSAEDESYLKSGFSADVGYSMKADVTANITVGNSTGEKANLACITAMYDGNKLAACDVGKASLENGGEASLQNTVSSDEYTKVVTYVMTDALTPVYKEEAPPPAVFKISDEIAPGDSFMVYGADITPNSVVYLEPAEKAGEEPSENSEIIVPKLVDTEGAFLTAVLPEEAVGGSYKVWVSNSVGTSEGLYLNNPRPFWVAGSDITAPGFTVQLIGACFDAERTGAVTNTRIKLLSGSQEYPAEITEVEPYSVRFTVPDNMPTGEYKIAITNNGNNWIILENEQMLSVVASANDPYGLGVAWADNYVYDNEVNVKDYGAKGDGIADDTEAVRSALTALENDGGGILYFPNGTYNVSEIAIPSHTILEGESKENTRLAYCKQTVRGKWIYSSESSLTEGYQGITNMTLCKSHEVTVNDYPSELLWIGHPWLAETVYVQGNRTFCGFFMKGVAFDFPEEIPENSTPRVYAIAKKYFLVDDVSGSAYKTCFMPAIADYTTVRNTNQTPYSSSNENIGRYTVYENNTINIKSDLKKEDGTHIYAQGIFLRSHAYLAHNRIENTGTPGGKEQNDGEIMCSENINGGAVRYTGYVSKGDTDSVSGSLLLGEDGEPISYGNDAILAGLDPLDAKWGDFYVVVANGKGLGQYRRLKTCTVNEDNTFTFTVDKPWDIVPDATSVILLTTLCEKVIYYDNYAEDCEKGFWMYGGAMDSIIDGNTGINTEGTLVQSFEIDGTGRRTPSYFVVQKNNSFDGVSKLGDVCQIANVVAYEVKETELCVGSYGAEIRSNTMKNATTEASSDKVSEAVPINGIFYGFTSPYISPSQNMVRAGIIEDNQLINMNTGITIGYAPTNRYKGNGVSGVLLKGNTFVNVTSEVTKNGEIENLVEIP